LIRLSSNQWKKVRHFGDTLSIKKRKRSGSFWLYVVTEAGADEPQLHRVQHPAAHFREGEDIFATGFTVHEETWREQSSSHTGDTI
jgi:hypothetical protein